MADVPYPTSNVSLYDEFGNVVGVTNNTGTGKNEVNVRDDDANTTLENLQTYLESAENHQNLWQHWTQEGYGFGYRRLFTTTSGTSEIDFVLMRNPSGSGKTIYGYAQEYTYTKGSGVSIARIYAGPTITANGTLETIFPLKPSAGNTSVASVYYAPTISARGSQVALFGQGATGTYSFRPDLGLMLEEGYDMLFTVQPAANNTDHSITLYWVEF